MALFTQFLQARRQAEQALRARGRTNFSGSEWAGVAAPVAATAAAEEQGRAAEMTRAEGYKDIEERSKRFAERLGIAHEELELGKKRAATEAELGRGRLKLGEHEYRHAKSMKPWAIGLGVGELGLTWKEGQLQRQRDEEIRQRWDKLFKPATYGTRGLSVPSTTPLKRGHTLRRGDIYYT